MMKKWIALLGSNATGKSTRMTAYVKSLGPPDRVLDYTFEKKGEMKTIKGAASIWGTTLIVGRPTRDGNKWVGGDHTMGQLGSMDCAKQFLTDISEMGIETVVFEAYFGTSSKTYYPERLRDYFDTVHNYWFIYDELQEYVDRTEARSGSTWENRGKDPEASAGWRSNLSYLKTVERTSAQVEGISSVERISVNAPKDWLIGKMQELL